MKYYILAFIAGLCAVSKSHTMSLSPEVMKYRVKQYFNEIENIQNPVEKLNKNDVKEYLQDRIAGAKTLLAGNRTEKTEMEYRRLDRNWARFATGNWLDNNPNARQIYYFAIMTVENVNYCTQKKLGCYAEELAEFEKTYNPPLLKVTIEDFIKKRNEEISTKDLDTLLLQNSRDFAQAVLDEIDTYYK